MEQLTKPTNIPTNQISQLKKVEFFDALNKLYEPNSQFKNLDLKNKNFKLTLRYPRNQFKNDIIKLIQNMTETEKAMIWDCFNFTIKPNTKGNMVMTGYPILPHNKKSLLNAQTITKKISQYVENFVEKNIILTNDKLPTQELTNILNVIFNTLPELYTIIGKEQHDTHDYTVDIHTLNVLQECIKNPLFEHLETEDKQTLILTCLLHDITKEEYSIDKSHPKESSIDAYYILEKLNLSEQQHTNIYQLIKNHDMLEQCNKGSINFATGEKLPITEEQQNIKVKNYALEFHTENMVMLALILTKADLISVKRDGSFFQKYNPALEKISKKLINEIKNISYKNIS